MSGEETIAGPAREKRGYDAGMENSVSKRARMDEVEEEPRLKTEATGQGWGNSMVPLPGTEADWMHKGKKVCGFYPQCRRGHSCNLVHIYTVPLDEESQLVFQSKELLTKKYRKNLVQECLKTLKVDKWFTAGFYNARQSRSMYFYAQGCDGKANQNGVYWYPRLHEAKNALQRAISFFSLDKRGYRDILKKEKSQNRPAISSISNGRDQELPKLEDRDWVDKEEFPRPPSDFDPMIMKNHKFWTVEARFGEAIGNPLEINLNPTDVHLNQINGFYTLAYTDRDYNKIIYVEGDNSRINDQGVHWYSSEAEAWYALERVVSASRTRSAAK